MQVSSRIKTMVENAACASQNPSLEDPVTVEAIARNVAFASFKAGIEAIQSSPNVNPNFLAKLFIGDGT